MKKVQRLASYRDDLRGIAHYVAQDKPGAAARLRLSIEAQVSKLADPNFPRRSGRVAGTKELVAHPNYIVVFVEDDMTVTVINVLHARLAAGALDVCGKPPCPPPLTAS